MTKTFSITLQGEAAKFLQDLDIHELITTPAFINEADAVIQISTITE